MSDPAVGSQRATAPVPSGTAIPLPEAVVAPAGYEILCEIDRGGMGVVYRARHCGLDRPVALKYLQERFTSEPSVTHRFLREARITARLQHPGIPPVYEVGELPDRRPFLAMKLIE